MAALETAKRETRKVNLERNSKSACLIKTFMMTVGMVMVGTFDAALGINDDEMRCRGAMV